MSLGHVLVIRPGALGDAILTLPVLRALRRAGAESITVLGTPASWQFLRAAHEGVRVRDFASVEWLGLFNAEAALGAAAKATLSRTATAIVYLTESSGVERVLKREGIRRRICLAPPVESRSGNSHAARSLLQPLSELGIAARSLDDALIPQDLQNDDFLKLDEFERIRVLEKLGLDADSSETFFAIHPGSGGRKKCWPAERFAQLVPRISRKKMMPVVFFGPADDAIRDHFENLVAPGEYWDPVVNWPLRDVLALLTFCRGYIGNDSGMTHLAARACPVTAIFGPTPPAIWSPLGKTVRILQAPDGDLARLTVAEVLQSLL